MDDIFNNILIFKDNNILMLSFFNVETLENEVIEIESVEKAIESVDFKKLGFDNKENFVQHLNNLQIWK